MSGISGFSLIASTILTATTAAKAPSAVSGEQKAASAQQSEKNTQALTIPIKTHKSDILA